SAFQGDLTADQVIRNAVRTNIEPSYGLNSFQCSTKTSEILNFDFSVNEDYSMRLVDNQTYGVTYWQRPDMHKYKMLREERIWKEKRPRILEGQHDSFGNFFNVMRRNAAGRINLGSFGAPSPLSDSCFTYYKYEIDSRVIIDNERTVYEIGFKPLDNDRPGLIGTFTIEDGTFGLVEADFTLNDQFEKREFLIVYESIGFNYKYVRYMGRYTLTDRLEVYQKIKISPFGKGDMFFTAEYSDYQLNINIDEKLYSGGFADYTEMERVLKYGLSPIDKFTAEAMERNRKKYDVAADKYYQIDGRFSDFFRFNRVEGAFTGAGLATANKLSQNFRVGLFAGYGFSDEKWKNRFFVSTKDLMDDKLVFRLSGYDHLHANNEWISPLGMNTFMSLLFKEDHIDFYYNKGFTFMTKFWPQQNFAARFKYFSEDHSNAYVNSDFSFFKRSRLFRSVRPVVEGKFSGIALQFHFNSRYGYTQKMEGISLFTEFLKADRKLGSNTKDFNRYFLELSQFRQLQKGFSYEISYRYGFGSAGLPPQYQFSNTIISEVGLRSDETYNYGNRMSYAEAALFYRHPVLDYIPFLNTYRIQLMVYANSLNIYSADTNNDPFRFPDNLTERQWGVGIDDANGFLRIAITSSSYAFRIRKIIPFSKFTEKF
ncbi:hypothetical protein ACFL7D_10930, partial [candidate division KSB1 bacterium]